MSEALLQVESLHKRFAVSGRRGAMLHAVDDVSLRIGAGESVGLVGESGCGKSTLVRLLARLLDPSDGRIVFAGQELGEIRAERFARTPQRAAIQMVFQDPTDSLNPRFSAREAIAEPLRLLTGQTGAQIDARVDEVALQVGLPLALLPRYAHQLSGGQKARVGIARALAVKPRLLILDEPTAALDVSVQAVVLQLLAELRQQLGLSYLFVSHDLNVVRLLTDRVAVMYLGKIVEVGPSEAVFRAPRHPYTQALVSAIPGQGPRIKLSGEVSSPIDPPAHVCR
ncbi:MAG: ATP-binding cassette protein, partial [Proteobacteria bacterium]|nr:ATP-binding cassette protein [Pseudomonadota bacterium]